MYVDSIKEHAQREEKAPEYIIKGMWGDWFPPHATEDENPATTNIYGTSYFYLMADIMSHIAEVLGKTEDAAHFAQLAENVKEAMNKAYFNPNDNSYPGYKSGDFLQSTSAIPLSMGMVPKENEKAVLNRLVEDIMVRRGGHLDTGLLATKALMESLADLDGPTWLGPWRARPHTRAGDGKSLTAPPIYGNGGMATTRGCTRCMACPASSSSEPWLESGPRPTHTSASASLHMFRMISRQQQPRFIRFAAWSLRVGGAWTVL